jgi:thermitase
VHFSWLRLTAALWHAIDRGAHVASMSLGGPLGSAALEEALDAAVDAGMILVAAAGNQWPFVVYPARCEQAIACAAINVERRRWAGSASGRDVDVAAPGESVWRARATRAGFGVDRSSGTSYATAHVAGIAALWLARHGRSNLVAKYGRSGIPVVFKELLTTAGVAGTPAAWPDDVLGAGIVNAQSLLAAPLPARARAAGARVRRAGRNAREGALDRLVAYFPGVDPDRVGEWLAREFGVRKAALPSRLASFGDEVAFHLTADPDAYAAAARALRRRSAVPPAARLLFRHASPTLERALA